ncbi:MAG TPA: hypothetical protein VGL53_19995 [Bryobacteraceae bacterium]|jgi:hypothetical protein
MRVLFDQGTPVPIRRYLTAHKVSLSAELGWDRLRNGDLLSAAEKEGFEVLLTTDKNLRYQQSLKDRAIAIVVIGHSRWPALQPHVQCVVEAVDAATPGSYAEVDIPYKKSGRS